MLRWIRSDETVVQNRYLEMLEKELAYYRTRYDAERLKGDRIADELIQARGGLPVSEIGVQVKDEAVVQAKEQMEIMKAQLNEIYGDGAEETVPLIDVENA